MASRVSRVMRRIRGAARKRGLPAEKILPVGEALVGLLIGLILGSVAWGLFRAAFLDYTTTAEVEVTVAGSRGEEAAALVASQVGGEEFQEEWRARIAELDLRVLAPVGAPRFRPSGRLMGGGTTRFRLVAMESGETTVVLSYRRPWAPTEPLQTFRVRVIVD